jgi:hypothetical protein
LTARDDGALLDRLLNIDTLRDCRDLLRVDG